MKTEDLNSKPLKSHTLYATPSTSPRTASPHKTGRTPLPSPASTTVTPVSASPRNSLRSPARSWNGSKLGLDKREVRWMDEKQDKSKGDNPSQRGRRSSEAHQMWARYRELVTPKFTLFEPKSSTSWRLMGKRDPDTDEDGRCFLKLALPCLHDCNLCVYSGQLGPVRVYFTTAKKPNDKLFHGSKSYHAQKYRGSVNHQTSNHAVNSGEENNENGEDTSRNGFDTATQEISVPQITVIEEHEIANCGGRNKHAKGFSRAFEPQNGKNFQIFPSVGRDKFHGSATAPARFPQGRHSFPPVNPLAHAATGTVYSTGGCMQKGVNQTSNSKRFQERSRTQYDLSLSNFSGTTKSVRFGLNGLPHHNHRLATNFHGKSRVHHLPVAWPADGGRKDATVQGDANWMLYRQGYFPRQSFKDTDNSQGFSSQTLIVPDRFPKSKRRARPGREQFS